MRSEEFSVDRAEGEDREQRWGVDEERRLGKSSRLEGWRAGQGCRSVGTAFTYIMHEALDLVLSTS